jgi:lysozyme family protein
MKNLDKETAKSIYKKNYWMIIRGDEILNQDSANDIYDTAVNMGCGAAIKLTQRSLGLPETGKMNVATLNKLNNV